jgi:2-polyprenyl-6-methoxyphenol hydroxylase-like FAD-dependent oxidoreductase
VRGPTGLVLALSLAQQRIRFHCIDENAGPGEHSRAMAVQARTLEFYREFGFADEMVRQGIKTAVAHCAIMDGRYSQSIWVISAAGSLRTRLY